MVANLQYGPLVDNSTLTFPSFNRHVLNAPTLLGDIIQVLQPIIWLNSH